MSRELLRHRLTRRALLASALAAPLARALGRRPYGGVLRLELPFAVDALDPHAAFDPGSALFAAAIADPLFAWDAQGKPYPALAAGLPESAPSGARVVLRPLLVTAGGRALDARDVIASIERSRRGAGRAVLAPFAPPERDRENPLAVLFPDARPEALADALASPVTAIVARAPSQRAPDGTGAFRARMSKDLLILEQNERAARGASYLERIEVRRAPDLATALRGFESGDLDVGFLGAGLHRRRALAVAFRTEPLGLVVLRTGADAKGWGAPGIAARLVDAIDPGKLAHLGLTAARSGQDSGWGGPPGEVLVDSSSAYLVEVAEVVALALSRPGHELRPAPTALAELRRRVASDHFALAIDFVRRIGPTPRHTVLSLLAASDPRLADKPPGMGVNPESVLRTLPLASLGELAVAGARTEAMTGLEAWDLGAVFRVPG